MYMTSAFRIPGLLRFRVVYIGTVRSIIPPGVDCPIHVVTVGIHFSLSSKTGLLTGISLNWCKATPNASRLDQTSSSLTVIIT